MPFPIKIELGQEAKQLLEASWQMPKQALETVKNTLDHENSITVP